MDEAQFETYIIEELEAVRTLMMVRRDTLITSAPISQESMARAFALGAAENAIWNLVQRAKGTR